MKLAAKTADNNFNVLIRGESGTGKELIAEAIHYSSERATQPFIRVNCAAIPEIYWKVKCLVMSKVLIPER